MPRIAIFHPTDPLGHVPGGIDVIIRGMLKWAPLDLEYTLFGATSDEHTRPIGRELVLPFGKGNARFIPLVSIDPKGRRAAVPVTLRYLFALWRYIQHGRCDGYDVLDFHRIDPLWLFRRDGRPRNVVLHQDMAVIRDPACDIMWRHAPWLYEWMERRLLRVAARVLTVRQSAIRRYGTLYPDLADRIAFLPTWFDSDVFSPPHDEEERRRLRAQLLAQLNVRSEPARILTSVGRLDRQKDPLLLLQALTAALRSHPELHLVLIGDGVLRPEIERACEAPELKGRVHLLGVLPPVAIANVLRASDLFVMSSAYEGMPIAVLEALATGLPVVSTNVGEVGLVVQDGSSGRICRERTTLSLATAISVALGEVDVMRGQPCLRAVAPYGPEAVLGSLYQSHRAQGGASDQVVSQRAI